MPIIKLSGGLNHGGGDDNGGDGHFQLFQNPFNTGFVIYFINQY